MVLRRSGEKSDPLQSNEAFFLITRSFRPLCLPIMSAQESSMLLTDDARELLDGAGGAAVGIAWYSAHWPR